MMSLTNIKMYHIQNFILQLIASNCLVCDINLQEASSKPYLVLKFINGEPVYTNPNNLLGMYIDNTVSVAMAPSIVRNNPQGRILIRTGAHGGRIVCSPTRGTRQSPRGGRVGRSPVRSAARVRRGGRTGVRGGSVGHTGARDLYGSGDL